LLWVGAALLLLFSACGGSDEEPTTQVTSTQPAVTVTPSPMPAPARTLAGEPPASPETERIEEIFAGADLPPKVEVFGRRDIPNESVEKDAPDAGARFREYGRVTGNYYVLTVDGAQRMTLSINRYGTTQGAMGEFDFGKGDPAPEDRVEAEGLGDARSALRSTLGDGGNKTSLYLISYTRGCYYVVVADFPPGGADAPPDAALALAQAVDGALQESASGAGGAPGCG
jgi:hypothetical protein